MSALSAVERAALLAVARGAIRHHLGIGPPPALPEEGRLGERKGAFVTLRTRGALRGCIGTFAPRDPLARTVAEMAVAAASRDPRFEPVTPDELDDLDVHVAVLGPPEPVRDPSEISVGRDGLVVKRGWHHGTLLPSVAAERGWDARTFLAQTCLKAGLPPDAWRSPDASVERFGTEEFGAADDG